MRKILTVVRVRGEWLNTDDCTVLVYEVNGDGALPMSDRASQWLRTAISGLGTGSVEHMMESV